MSHAMLLLSAAAGVLCPVSLQRTTSSPFNLPRLLLSLALRPGLQTHMLVGSANTSTPLYWLLDWVIQYACTLPHTSIRSRGGDWLIFNLNAVKVYVTWIREHPALVMHLQRNAHCFLLIWNWYIVCTYLTVMSCVLCCGSHDLTYSVS